MWEELQDLLPEGWIVENDAVLICPHGHSIEYDGRCPEGCVSPLIGMGMIQMTYNGWTNWKTWNTYNWLTSDEATYRYVTNMDSWMLKQYIDEEVYETMRHRYQECVRMLNGLERTLEKKLPVSQRQWSTPNPEP